MKFVVQKDVFEVLPNVYFGVVIARGVDNRNPSEMVAKLLDNSIEEARKRFKNVNIKDHPQISPYREAFNKLGINPNRFLSSIEALTRRVSKGGDIPKICNIVNLANAMSLKYTLPIGAHDMAQFDGDMMVRFSKEGDLFIPFGKQEPEEVEPHEPVYANGHHVKTRKWIWRQSETGKITEESRDIFFPIDGFKESNYEAVNSARDELADILQDLFGCDVKKGFVDKDHPYMDL